MHAGESMMRFNIYASQTLANGSLKGLLFLTLMLCHACSDLSSHGSRPKVIGGEDAVRPAFFMNLTDRTRPYFGCGATYLGGQWAMTAAHCIHRDRDSQIYLTWADDRQGIRDKSIEVDAIIVHPDYSHSTEKAHDIALLHLKHLPPERTLGEVRELAPGELGEASEELATVGVGYGNGTSYGDLQLEKLQQVSLQIQKHEICKKTYPYYDKNTTLCAMDLESRGGFDTCSGDSGGPLISLGPQPQVVGIVSHALIDSCAQPGVPGVYTRVSHYRSWIEKTQKSFNDLTPAQEYIAYCYNDAGSIEIESTSVVGLNNRLKLIYEIAPALLKQSPATPSRLNELPATTGCTSYRVNDVERKWTLATDDRGQLFIAERQNPDLWWLAAKEPAEIEATIDGFSYSWIRSYGPQGSLLSLGQDKQPSLRFTSLRNHYPLLPKLSEERTFTGPALFFKVANDPQRNFVKVTFTYNSNYLIDNHYMERKEEVPLTSFISVRNDPSLTKIIVNISPNETHGHLYSWKLFCDSKFRIKVGTETIESQPSTFHERLYPKDRFSSVLKGETLALELYPADAGAAFKASPCFLNGEQLVIP
jgi:secreted trypsin-like serine protease